MNQLRPHFRYWVCASHHGAHLRLHGGVGHRLLHLLHLGGHLLQQISVGGGQRGRQGSWAEGVGVPPLRLRLRQCILFGAAPLLQLPVNQGISASISNFSRLCRERCLPRTWGFACACSSAALSAAPLSASDCAALTTCRRALCGALRLEDAPAGRAATAQGLGATVAASMVGESTRLRPGRLWHQVKAVGSG